MNYMWNGEQISDIHEWTRKRGEEMVRVRKTWTEPNIFAGRFEKREEEIEMPAVFFNGMRFGGPNDTSYTELSRYTP